MTRSKKQVILLISDLHAPYSHKDAYRFLKWAKERFKPTEVICGGDEVDYHALSFHDSDPDLLSAGDELKAAKKQLAPIFKLFPNVVCLESNHGSLVMRKALTNGIPRAMFKSYNEILDAPKGWRWVFDYTIKTPLGPVYFCHGKTGTPGRLSAQYGMCTVQAHFHSKAQISYTSTPERLLWDMHIGSLVNDKSLALGYNKLDVKRSIISIAIIIDGVPQIIPMLLNKKGRWIEKM